MTALTPWRYVFVIGMLMAGCGLKQPIPAPVVDVRTVHEAPASGEAQRVFQLGLQQYDQGQYKKAAASLQQAIDMGLSPDKRVIAHKHLAFIYCVTHREGQCRNEFTKILAVDANFNFDPAEAGHPKWGPVFRSVKTVR